MIMDITDFIKIKSFILIGYVSDHNKWLYIGDENNLTMSILKGRISISLNVCKVVSTHVGLHIIMFSFFFLFYI